MRRGGADAAICDVKQAANDGAVTYLRIKLPVSDKDVGVKGLNTLTIMILLQTVRKRSAEQRVIIITII